MSHTSDMCDAHGLTGCVVEPLVYTLCGGRVSPKVMSNLEFENQVFVVLHFGKPGHLRGGTDKSLARPNSRCSRTESRMSLVKGSVHVPNCKTFLVTEAERKHVRRRARFQQHRDASCRQVSLPLLQSKAP